MKIFLHHYFQRGGFGNQVSPTIFDVAWPKFIFRLRRDKKFKILLLLVIYLIVLFGFIR